MNMESKLGKIVETFDQKVDKLASSHKRALRKEGREKDDYDAIKLFFKLN